MNTYYYHTHGNSIGSAITTTSQQKSQAFIAIGIWNEFHDDFWFSHIMFHEPIKYPLLSSITGLHELPLYGLSNCTDNSVQKTYLFRMSCKRCRFNWNGSVDCEKLKKEKICRSDSFRNYSNERVKGRIL